MRFVQIMSTAVALILTASALTPVTARAESQQEIEARRNRHQGGQNGGARQQQVQPQKQQPTIVPRAPAQPVVRAPVVKAAPQIYSRAAPIARAPVVETRRESGRVFERAREPERRVEAGRRFDGGWRRDAGRHEVGRYGGHRRFALGAGIVVIGGILGYELYRRPNREDVFDRCDRNFPDFDYDTGSFVNDDGDREICPYLLD